MSEAPEPVVTPNVLEFMVPCPWCGEWGTHLGTCRLSVMRSGSLYTIWARRENMLAEDTWRRDNP